MKWIAGILLLVLMVGVASATVVPLESFSNTNAYYYNITPGMGAQTEYQMKFTLSNSSGTSGYYAPYNVIYTGGTTRADWYDINFTDSSDTPLKFWVENNTQTATNATVWVKVPSIAVDNSSSGKCYFGNATQDQSTQDGLNTFILFDDFLGAAYNTTKWPAVVASGGTIAVSNGEVNVTSTGLANYGINSSTFLGGNHSIITRAKQPIPAANSLSNIGFRGIQPSETWRSVVRLNVGNVAILNNAGSDSVTNTSTVGTGFNKFQLSRNATGSTRLLVNDTYAYEKFDQVTSNATPQAIYSYNAGSVTIVDWIAVAKYLPVEPITSLYTTTGGTTINASFTQSDNPSTVGQAVTFTDTSTGTPTTWNWTIEGVGVTNTTQNMDYIFSTAGTYYIDLNITNSTGAISNITIPHVVTNITRFTRQDVWLRGEYTHQFVFTDSATGLPIQGALVETDNNIQNTSITNGSAWITEPFGTYSLIFTASGYDGRQIVYVFDSNTKHDIQLTKTTTKTQQQNTWWTPHTVQVTVFDSSYGTRLYDVNIRAHYNESSMPTTWINDLYGIQSGPQADMINKTLIMNGTTGSAGTVTFTMLGSLKYDFILTAPQYGISNYLVMEYPSDNMMNIYVMTSSLILPTSKNSTYSAMNQTRVYYTEPNIGNISMCVNYSDISGQTSSVTFYWKFQNNGTQFNTTTVSPGTSLYTICNVSRNVRGTQYFWGYNSTRNVV